MVDPVTALLIATAAALIVGALFWPRRGLFARLALGLRAGARVRIEDALKHFYDYESQGISATVHSLSGALGLSGNRAMDLAAHLLASKLVTTKESRYELTPEGRRYALRVIRVHRLWEQYLSDETELEPWEWHSVADRREHTTSPEQANRLAARMGYPRYDPHGDPIPTADGDIAPPRGLPITELAEGQTGEIVHIEDEPETVYAQLVAEGMRLNMRVRLFEKSAKRVRFEADGEEHVLAPVVAANLSVVPLAAAEQATDTETTAENLATLRVGERAVVTGISSVCRGVARRRLLDLGVVPGSVVEAEMRSSGGDPTAYRLRGALIALRSDQARLIQIERNGAEATP